MSYNVTNAGEKAVIFQSSPLIHFDFRSGSDKTEVGWVCLHLPSSGSSCLQIPHHEKAAAENLR